jgi:signal transduction histidine kinase
MPGWAVERRGQNAGCEERDRRDPGRLELAIVDDRVGFDTRREQPGHLGLRTMEERAQAIGGTPEVQSEPGHGTTVRVVIA